MDNNRRPVIFGLGVHKGIVFQPENTNLFIDPDTY